MQIHTRGVRYVLFSVANVAINCFRWTGRAAECRDFGSIVCLHVFVRVYGRLERSCRAKFYVFFIRFRFFPRLLLDTFQVQRQHKTTPVDRRVARRSAQRCALPGGNGHNLPRPGVRVLRQAAV